MGLVVTNVSEETFLNAYFVLASLSGGHSLRLFTNDVTAGLTPSQIDLLDAADFTEANFTGYSAATVNGGWTFTQGDPTIGVNSQKTFTRTSTGTAQLIRGYYVTAVGDGALAWFEQFSAAISIEFNGDAIQITPRITLDDTGGNNVQPGTITAFGGSTAPTGWLLCQGQAVSRTTFASLFAVLGTTYGSGDGSTTFNVPNLQQRFPLGKATSGTGATLGSTGGTVDHVHDLNTASAVALIESQASGTISPFHRRKTGITAWTPTIQQSGGGTATAWGGGTTTNATGLQGNTATANPPFQVVNFIVKT